MKDSILDKNDENLITLKEAAEMSGYTADYVGQLIRSGKIPGKQVCAQIAWMTTSDAVLDYKNKSKQSSGTEKNGNFFTNFRRKMMMEVGVLKLFLRTFRSSLLILLIIFSVIIISSYYIFNTFFENNETKSDSTTEEVLLF